MLKYVKGNILDAPHGVICHQVNCQGVMGAGIAKSIKIKYPTVFLEYTKLVHAWGKQSCLGKCQIIGIKSKTLFVANLFGQFFYGRDKRYTDYGAVSMALSSLSKWHTINCHPDFPIFIPYKMGCANAGGDWKEMSNIIENLIPKAIIVRLPDIN